MYFLYREGKKEDNFWWKRNNFIGRCYVRSVGVYCRCALHLPGSCVLRSSPRGSMILFSFVTLFSCKFILLSIPRITRSYPRLGLSSFVYIAAILTSLIKSNVANIFLFFLFFIYIDESDWLKMRVQCVR